MGRGDAVSPRDGPTLVRCGTGIIVAIHHQQTQGQDTLQRTQGGAVYVHLPSRAIDKRQTHLCRQIRAVCTHQLGLGDSHTTDRVSGDTRDNKRIPPIVKGEGLCGRIIV